MRTDRVIWMALTGAIFCVLPIGAANGQDTPASMETGQDPSAFATPHALVPGPDAERRRAANDNAVFLIERLRGETYQVLESERSLIERTLEEYAEFAEEPKTLLPDLLTFYARALSNPKNGTKVTDAWAIALDAKRSHTSMSGMQDLLIEAAIATGQANQIGAARNYLSAAKQIAVEQRGPSDLLDIQFKVRELLATGGSRDWREVEDEITDMRDFGRSFAMWSREQFEILLLEIELRLRVQPEAPEKRESLSFVREELMLAYKAQVSPLTQILKNRFRGLLRTLEDTYQLS